MSTPPQETQQTQFLLTSLVLVGLFILGLALLLAAYPSVFAPSPTETPTVTLTLRPTLTPSPSPTLTLTPTPSRTPRATFTPSLTPTPTLTVTPSPTPSPTGPPTLTPARPVIGAVYSLNPWGPDDAQRVIDLFDYFPNTLSAQARGKDNAAYYQAYQYAAFAQREALLRFPNAPQAPAWRWGLGYNLARTGDPQAGQVYGELITQALNRGETDINTLSAWLTANDPRLILGLIQLDPPSGYTSSHLLEVREIVGRGSAFLWLLGTPGAFQFNVLDSHYDFVHHTEATSIVTDLDSDGQDELMIYRSVPTGTFTLPAPLVFNLAKLPARQLPFNPSDQAYNIGMDFTNNWIVRRNLQGQNDLVFSSPVFPACPVTIERTYRWDGQAFGFVDAAYSAQPPGPDTLAFCRLAVEHAARFWGPQAAATVVEAILPVWPPEKMEDGTPFPPDARDEMRFRLGIYRALAGDTNGAVQVLNEIIASPTIPTSRWVAQAKAFLSAYASQADLYRACVGVELCDPASALQSLINGLPADAYPGAMQAIWDAGAATVASGYFDFDKDGEKERWFTVRHRPQEKLQFWVLTRYTGGVAALPLGVIDSNSPKVSYYDEEATPPVVQIDGNVGLVMRRDPGTLKPSIEPVDISLQFPNRYLAALRLAEDALFAGVDPVTVREQLIAMQVDPGLKCKYTWSCDPYYYLLGLASEQAGDEQAAIDAYTQLWWDYSRSPYTTMARLKLAGLSVVPSGTPVPTATRTVPASSTPTITGTPPTRTPTLTPTVTNTAITVTPRP